MDRRLPVLRPACCAGLALIALLAAQAGARDRAEVRAFRAQHACPATAQHRGACPGFQVDHVVPLCAGGEDKPHNMQWIAVDDHRFKTLVDVRECRKLRKVANTPAR
jgi:hypothetical protein